MENHIGFDHSHEIEKPVIELNEKDPESDSSDYEDGKITLKTKLAIFVS